MKTGKRKKHAPEAASAEPPDAAYVAALLGGSEPVAEAPNTTGPQTVGLPVQCEMRSVVEFKSQLQPLLENDDVTLDATVVERVDTAFMQMLLAFVSSRSKAGRTTAWSACSDVFAAAAKLLGMSKLLGMEQSLGLGGAGASHGH